MAEIFNFYVQDNRSIQFPKNNLLEPIMQEDHNVAVWRFRIPKVLNAIDMSGYAWWFVYVNAGGQEFSELLTLVDDIDEPDSYCTADYSIDYGISYHPGNFQFSLEAINADSGGEVLNEWHTKTYAHKVDKTLQGNQVRWSETESDIISALIVEVQNKVAQLVGGATPEPKNLVADMTDSKKVYLYVGNEEDESNGYWYYHNGTRFVPGGLYASGVTIDSTPTQGSTNAVSSGGVWSKLNYIESSLGSITTSSVTANDLSSNWYKGISENLANEEYNFVITVQTAGTYLFQIGYGGSASAMSLDVGTYTFTAGETKRITYTPIGNNLKYFRLYSANVPVGDTIWTLKIEQVITAQDLEDTSKKVDNIITAMECEVISTTKNKYYNTKADTVDITSPITNNTWNCAVVPCVSGDVFTITGRGGDTPRLWAFIDGNGNVISRQDSTLNPSKVKDYELYAPASSAYLIVNFMNTEEYQIVKGVSFKNRFEIGDFELKDNIAHIVHVANDGSGDFATLAEAYSSITDSSFDNQYDIIVHDGTYTEQYLTPPPFTHTHGTKADNVIITSVGLPYYDSISDWASVFQMLNTCKLSNMTVISGTKYCIHEDDPKLSRKVIVCENVKFYQTQAHNVSAIGNGTQFGGTKYIFRDCVFINGAVAVHTNTQMIAGANQHMILDSCKFIDSYVSLQSVVTTEVGNQGLYVCEVKNCRFKSGVFAVELRIGNAISGSNVPNFPWTLCGSGNENFGIRFDVSRDTRFTDCWDAINTIEKTFVKASATITKGDYVTESGEVTTQANAYGMALTNAVSGDYVPVWTGAIYPAVTV